MAAAPRYPPLTDKQHVYYAPLLQNVVGLCAELEIDPAGPRALELLILALIEESESEFVQPETVPARRKPPSWTPARSL